jgi:hypothetical protein
MSAIRIASSLGVSLAVAWAVAALWIDGPEPRGTAAALSGAAIVFAALAALLLRPWWRATAACFAVFSVVLVWWLTLAPSNARDWQPAVARLPRATIDGSLLTIENVRSFEYHETGGATERWETRSYDLDELVGVDVFISFWGPTLYGHTITSWEFADGRFLAMSIETRKERSEEYSAVRGFFRQFELYYVVAEERDAIGVRAGQRGETIQLYRTLASPEDDRALLLDYVRELNALADRPRWYNALTHNCTTTIWHHTNTVGLRFPVDWRLLANGYLVDLAYELGTVDTRLELEELKRRSDITERARSAGAGDDFSKTVRSGLPPRPTGEPNVPLHRR